MANLIGDMNRLRCVELAIAVVAPAGALGPPTQIGYVLAQADKIAAWVDGPEVESPDVDHAGTPADVDVDSWEAFLRWKRAGEPRDATGRPIDVPAEPDEPRPTPLVPRIRPLTGSQIGTIANALRFAMNHPEMFARFISGVDVGGGLEQRLLGRTTDLFSYFAVAVAVNVVTNG